MFTISSVSISIQLTPQTIAIIVAILIVLAIILGIGGRRHRRRRRAGGAPRPRRSGTARSGISRPRRRDHGLEIAKRHGTARSPQWSRVEKEHLLHEPACAACGFRGKGLQVHHVKPFHLHPNLELDPGNLITLCEIKGRDHHLLLGHLDEWESYNVNVRDDVRRYHGKTERQIKADVAWQKAVAKRP